MKQLQQALNFSTIVLYRHIAPLLSNSQTPLPTVDSTDNGKVLTVSNGAWAAAEVDALPSVTSSDNGKILTVESGVWAAASASPELPTVTSSDNGKILGVDNGAWSAVNNVVGLPSAGASGQVLIKSSASDYDVGWGYDTSRVAKSGDTMTGNLAVEGNNNPCIAVRNPEMDATAASITNAKSAVFEFHDVNNRDVGYIMGAEQTNGRDSITLAARKVINSSDVDNFLELSVDKDGNKIVAVNDAAAWRTALNVVNKSGDSMTGNLVISEALINFNTDLSVSTPNSDEYKKAFFINDASNNWVGYVEAQHSTSGNRGIDLVACREINSSLYYNGMQLLIDESGNANVYLTAPSAWRDAIGAVNRSGDSMTGTLSINDPVLEDGVLQDSWGTARLNLSDKNGVRFGTIYPYSQVMDVDKVTQGVRFGVSRTINGTSYSNGFLCGINQDGSGHIYLYDSNAWLYALGLTVEDTSTISDICSAASGYSISSAYFFKWGHFVQLQVTVERTGSAITAETNASIFTMVSDKKPRSTTALAPTNTQMTYGSLSYTGTCTIRVTAWAKNAEKTVRAVYLV